MPSALERQFHGTCALVRVQLMRAAERSDVEECFPLVRERELISAEDERLIRACFAEDERLFSCASEVGSKGEIALGSVESRTAGENSESRTAGESSESRVTHEPCATHEPRANAEQSTQLISKETIARLHMIVSSKLNVADSA